MSMTFSLKATTSLVAAVVMAGAAVADEVNHGNGEVERSNWVPNVGVLDFEAGEQPLGDL